MAARQGWIHGLLLGLLLLGWSALSTALHAPPLSAEQAFQLQRVVRTDEQTLRLYFSTAPGYSLYRDRMQIRVIKPDSVRLGKPQFPSSALFRLYPDGTKMQVFSGDFSIWIPALFLDPKAEQVTLEIRYQGCSDADICYPEAAQIAQLPLLSKQPAQLTPVTIESPAPTRVATSQSPSTHWWWRLLGFFGMGLLLAFTPCVLPMIPILSGLILGTQQPGAQRALGLSLSYVLAMAATYAVIGLVAGLIGSSLQAWFQTPWVLISFSVVVIMMALALFGWFDVELPQGLRARMAQWSQHALRGHYSGAALMGILSTLILSPCATPALAAAMLYLAKQGAAGYGALALFVMALGMGAPLLILGAFGAKWLPKAGKWMILCKAAAGFFLLAVAISMLTRLLPGRMGLVLWSLLALGLAAYSGIMMTTPQSTLGRWLSRTLALSAFTYGIVLLIGAWLGQTDPLRPLPGTQASRQPVHFQTVNSLASWAVERRRAELRGHPILVDIYADWCVACLEMERFTWSNPKVQRQLQHFTLIRIDMTANRPETRALLRALKVIAPPTLLFLDVTGQELPNTRQLGFVDANTLSRLLAAILSTTSANQKQP